MLASLFQPHITTANLLFIGLIQGLIVSMLGMGIVLVYRSTRVINFAVANMGLPAAALLAVMVVRSHFPYWVAFVLAVASTAIAGAVIDLVVIRRLFKAPRVIVLVATIGVAQLMQAIVMTLPDYRTGKFQTQFPTPIASKWSFASLGHLNIGGFHAQVTHVTITGAQLLALIVVPIVTVGLWWLLGHTNFGQAVRASATNPDLARLTGISPKMMSTAIWTIAGMLSGITLILYATQSGTTDLVKVGPETLLLGLTAALIGGMTSFPRTVAGAIGVGVLYQVLQYNFPNSPGVVEFVLFLLVLALVAYISRTDAGAGNESFAFAPRVPPVPERLREVWWVRRMPNLTAWIALAFACVVPFVITQSSHQQAYSLVLATAIVAVSVTVLTGWAGQLSLGQAAFAGLGALSAGALIRGITLNVGWRAHRLAKGAVRPYPMIAGLILVMLAATAIGIALARHRDTRVRVMAAVAAALCIVAGAVVFPAAIDRTGTDTLHRVPFVLAVIIGAAIASAVAAAVGVGALRVRGLLLAVSTMAFAIAAEVYVFPRPILVGTEGSGLGEVDRGKLGPLDLTQQNRAYYFFVARHPRRRPAPRRASPPYRRRPRDRRRPRERSGRLGVHRVADPNEAHRVRARRLPRGTGRRRAGGHGADVQLPRGVLSRRGFTFGRRDGGDRRTRQPRGRRHGRLVGRRPPVVLAEERDGRPPHVEHRPADRAAVHPRRFHAAGVLVARCDPALARGAAARTADEDGDDPTGLAHAPHRSSRWRRTPTAA